MGARACPPGDRHGFGDLRTSATIPVPNFGAETAEAPTVLDAPRRPRGREPAARPHVSSHDGASPPQVPAEAQEKGTLNPDCFAGSRGEGRQSPHLALAIVWGLFSPDFRPGECNQ